MELARETGFVEAILFLESDPLPVKQLAIKAQLSDEVTEKCIENLIEKYKDDSSGVELSMITGGWCLVPKKECWEVLKETYGSKRDGKLSKSAMETLSIIAYSQPVTRSEIEAIRGVGVDNALRLLIDRNLVKEVGKKDAPGRPTQFGTTKEFLKLFRLNSIADLPKLDENEAERFELAR
ncbi:MAG: SMC-Scp complex subunit ScpB [Treponema sp.]|nr:SMC-Scp complex subunit ScpB [Treponema sp.]